MISIIILFLSSIIYFRLSLAQQCGITNKALAESIKSFSETGKEVCMDEVFLKKFEYWRDSIINGMKDLNFKFVTLDNGVVSKPVADIKEMEINKNLESLTKKHEDLEKKLSYKLSYLNDKIKKLTLDKTTEVKPMTDEVRNSMYV
jgi:hypothetical protein